MQTLTPLDGLLVTIVLAVLAIGLPIFFVAAIRFLWERSLSLSRSKELEKLIWQLHRIASAMELQMNVSFPAVQPGTEDATDLAYFQQTAAPGQAKKTTQVPVQTVAAPVAAAEAAPVQRVAMPVAAAPPAPMAPPPVEQVAAAPTAEQAAAQPTTAEPEGEEPRFHPIVPRDPSAPPPRSPGVNSMFGF